MNRSCIRRRVKKRPSEAESGPMRAPRMVRARFDHQRCRCRLLRHLDLCTSRSPARLQSAVNRVWFLRDRNHSSVMLWRTGDKRSIPVDASSIETGTSLYFHSPLKYPSLISMPKSDLTSLLLVLLARLAQVLGYVFIRLRHPKLVGEILAGIVFDPVVPQHVPAVSTLVTVGLVRGDWL